MIQKGSNVTWKWGRGNVNGRVMETFDRAITITSKGTKVTRKGTPLNRALYIHLENGTEVLKLESEVEMI